jgi:hypothetical protein
VVRKPNKLLWMHEQDGRPGFWLDDLAALQAFTNHVLEQGIEQGRRAERADTIAYVKRMLTMMGRGHGLARDLEHGRHINAAKTDEPHLGAAGKGGA